MFKTYFLDVSFNYLLESVKLSAVDDKMQSNTVGETSEMFSCMYCLFCGVYGFEI